MQIKRNADGTISATFSEHEASALEAELLWVKNVDEDGPVMALWTALSDELTSDEPEELCPGCVGRGTGEYCVLCNCRIPENLRRKPGDPPELIPAPGPGGQCRCMVPIPHAPDYHEAAQREAARRAMAGVDSLRAPVPPASAGQLAGALAGRSPFPMSGETIPAREAEGLMCVRTGGDIWALCLDGVTRKVEG